MPRNNRQKCLAKAAKYEKFGKANDRGRNDLSYLLPKEARKYQRKHKQTWKESIIPGPTVQTQYVPE